MIQTLENVLEGHFSKEKAVNFVKSDQNVFFKALDYAVSDHYPLGWRSAWIVFHTMEDNDERIKPLINTILESFNEAKKDGHHRELLKIIYRMNLDDDQEGVLFDKCMSIWESVKKSPSVRSMAFKILIGIAQKYPELRNELDFIMQAQYLNSLSPGIKLSVERQYKKAFK